MYNPVKSGIWKWRLICLIFQKDMEKGPNDVSPRPQIKVNIAMLLVDLYLLRVFPNNKQSSEDKTVYQYQLSIINTQEAGNDSPVW